MKKGRLILVDNPQIVQNPIVPLIVFNSANFIGVEITKEISMLNIAIKMFFVVTVPVIQSDCFLQWS